MGRTYRFFTNILKDENLEREILLTLSNEREIVEQLTKVLRAKINDEVVLMHSRREPPYREFHYTVETADKKSVRLKLTDVKENMNECARRTGLILCLPNKPEKLSFILQKAVELGASGVTLVRGDNSQMKHDLRLERLRKIMKEAAEQSERGRVPELNEDGFLYDYLAKLDKNEAGKMLAAVERSGAPALAGIAEKCVKGDAAVLVGPEGGFSEREKKLISARGLKVFSLGKRILRMETAVILSLGILTMAD